MRWRKWRASPSRGSAHPQTSPSHRKASCAPLSSCPSLRTSVLLAGSGVVGPLAATVQVEEACQGQGGGSVRGQPSTYGVLQSLFGREALSLVDLEQVADEIFGCFRDVLPRECREVQLDRPGLLRLQRAPPHEVKQSASAWVPFCRAPGLAAKLTSATGSVCLYGNLPPNSAKQITPRLHRSAGNPYPSRP